MTLMDILGRVESREKTLTVFNSDVPEHVFQDIETHFAVQNVAVRQAQTESGLPRDFAVLYKGAEFLAASPLSDLREALAFEGKLFDTTDFDSLPNPEVLTHVDDTVFTSYSKRRMILASREIEERAWRVGGGELHVGFQRLSLLRDQWDLYEKIVESGCEAHVYGSLDCDLPESSLAIHATEENEIKRTWFVVFDAPDGATDCALLAEESEPNRFYGFWTYDSGIVGEIRSHLRETYPLGEETTLSSLS
ncbi:DICT sensory domain-containing protein [Haladaptatus litoreus]|nr:DICT sensory domain-containing protein [Haladaptatus litoreus]